VIAQTAGGAEVRIKPGAPGIGEIIRIPVNDSYNVVLAGAPGLETKSVLTNSDHRKRIISVADRLMEELGDTPTMDSFMASSKQFAHSIGLMTSRVRSALNKLEAANLSKSSMVMLGDSIFCFCDDNESAQATDILSRFWNPDQVQVTGISENGGRLVE
jgi:pantoate kinase